MKRFLIPLILLFGKMVAAQDYGNICTPGITFFLGHDQNFKAFRLDSLSAFSNSDTNFFSYRTIRDSTQYIGFCKDTSNGNALGRKIIKTHDGWFWFFNKRSEWLRINSQAGLNETWKYCALPGDCFLWATVTSIENDSVAGTTDTVKVITLQAKNASGINIPNIFNQKTIRLSKHYGFSRLYEIYWTPYDTLGLVLIGKTVPPIGTQPFDWSDIYDFDVGDEFHYYGSTAYNGYMTTHSKTIYKILDKTVYGNMDSVYYQTERCKKTWLTQPPTTTFHDTVVQFCNFVQMAGNPIIRLLPDEFYTGLEPGEGIAPAVSRSFSQFNHRPVQIFSQYGFIYYSTYNCYIAYNVGGGTQYKYVPGLGMTNYLSVVSDMYVLRTSLDLVYFKKEGETWGNPVSTDCMSLVTGTPENYLEVSVEVFPNPSVSGVTVRLGHPGQSEAFIYTLFSYSGVRVCEGNASSNPFVIPRNHLASGLYILVVTDRRGTTVGKSKISFE